MSLKLDELLNPTPANAQRVESEDYPGHNVKSIGSTSATGVGRDSEVANTSSIAVTQAFEAANTLTALATQGLGASTRGFPIHELALPKTASDRSPFRQNSLGGNAGVPLEPSTSATQDPPTHSPTLEQYHHGSCSPEEKRRRESLALRSSPPPVLPPLQNLAGQTSGDAQASNAVTDQSHSRNINSALPHIKTESSVVGNGASQLAVPASSAEPPSPAQALDVSTMAAIEAIKNEHGLRGGRAKAAETQDASPDSTAKRPPAKSASKKGVAKKPPTKKRKIDKDDTALTSRPSPTPAKSTKGISKSAAGKGGSKSATPAIGSSPVPASNHEDEDDDGGSEDEELYCICRRKDDHSWMIACDGGCDDWFHGKCVQMKEADGPLIDKYICPNCEKKGDAVTTWKPMCRTEGCRNPARVAKSNASKYCSDECGVKFMKMAADKTRKAQKENTSSTKKAKKRRREEHNDAYGASSDEEDLGPRGGMLRIGEVKALANDATDIDSFRRLGDGVLSPPPSATEKPAINGEVKPVGGDDNSIHTTLLPNEDARLSSIAEEKSAMRARMAILKDKEKFVAMAKDQVMRYAERENIKPKDVCGFDVRLSWSEGEFDRWRQDTVGVTALESGVLDLPPASNGVEVKEEENHINGDDDANGGDVSMTNGDSTSASPSDPTGVFCAKKRCERHKQWQKIALQDVRFDEADLADRMRALEREEREIRERGMLRRRREVAMGAGENSVERIAV